MKTFTTSLGLLCLGLAPTIVFAAPAPEPQIGSTTLSDFATSTSSAFASASASSSGSNACAQLSAATAPQPGVRITFKPSTVLACLQSVPFESTAAVNLVDYIANFTQFQSTLGYLKAPPADYPFPAVDVVSGLQEIRQKAAASKYDSEYAFESELYTLFTRVRDGHFAAIPALVGGFVLRRVPLVSISSNGDELPKIYFQSDIVNSTGGYTPSEVTRIDDQDAAAVAGGLGVSYQDRDAAYNSGFYNPANFRVFGNGDFAGSLSLTMNDTTKYQFANGSTITLNNTVTASVNITGITSGSDLYRKVVLPATSGSAKSLDRQVDDTIHWDRFLQKRADPTQSISIKQPVPTSTSASRTGSASATATVLPAQLGLPSPVVISPDLSISGYFLDEQPDTAYLYIAQFTVEGQGGAMAFQDTITDFLQACKQKNKKKLVIDVRGNPGGAVFTAYDAFKQIVPKSSLITKIRMRNHAAQDALGTVISQLTTITSKDLKILEGSPTQAQKILLTADVSGFNSGNNLQSPDGKPYGSWKDFNGPLKANNDNFSKFYYRQFNNDALLQITADGVVPAGYGSNKNLATAYFDPKNITIITDSQCSSSCGVFTNLMTSQANVSTITFGGRPNKNKMNLIGGTQGANVQKATSLSSIALAAGALIDAGTVTRPSDSQVRAIENLLFENNNLPPLQLSGSGMNINFLDNFNTDSDVPLQFRQIPAACRAFYIADDIISMRKTWARLSAGNFSCVDGGVKPGSPGNGGGMAQGGKKSAASTTVRVGGPVWLVASVVSAFMLLL